MVLVSKPFGSLITRLSGNVPALGRGTSLTGVPVSRSCGLGLPTTPDVARVNRVARADRPVRSEVGSTLVTALNAGRVLLPIEPPLIAVVTSDVNVEIVSATSAQGGVTS